jgi:hypothetical protein
MSPVFPHVVQYQQIAEPLVPAAAPTVSALSWGPSFPDFVRRAALPVALGLAAWAGPILPPADAGALLQWGPELPDNPPRAPARSVDLLTGYAYQPAMGQWAPPPLTWRPTYPDQPGRAAPRTAEYRAFAYQPALGNWAPPPISWAPVYTDQPARAAPRPNAGPSTALVQLVQAAPALPPLTWAPWAPVAVERASWRPSGLSAFVPLVAAAPALPPLTWLGTIPDLFRLPSGRPAGGLVSPLGPVDPPPLSWSPTYPDATRGPAARPAGMLAYVPVPSRWPVLFWAPSFPDILPRALPRPPGSLVLVQLVAPPPPAPLLSWAPSFPDFARAAPSWFRRLGGSDLPAGLALLLSPRVWVGRHLDIVSPVRPSMAADVTYYEGDTAPSLVCTLRKADRSILPIPIGASVAFHMRPKGTGAIKVNRSCSVIGDGSTAQVQVDWQAGDLTLGLYVFEFLMTFSNGTTQTIRGTPPKTLEVLPRLTGAAV